MLKSEDERLQEFYKEVLENIKEYMQDSIDKGYSKFIYNDLGWDVKCVDVISAIDTIKDLYQKEKEKNKNKNKILRNIREEFLKYNWKDANPIQTYNQVKSLYKAIYLKPYED